MTNFFKKWRAIPPDDEPYHLRVTAFATFKTNESSVSLNPFGCPDCETEQAPRSGGHNPCSLTTHNGLMRFKTHSTICSATKTFLSRDLLA